MAESQRESQRPGHKVAATVDEATLVKKERMFLVTFFLGGIALVAAMFWIAEGLSQDFSFTSTTFIVFASATGVSVLSGVLSKLLIRERKN